MFSQGAWRQREANMRNQNMLQRKRMCLHRAMVVSIPEKEPVQVSTFIFTSKSFRWYISLEHLSKMITTHKTYIRTFVPHSFIVRKLVDFPYQEKVYYWLSRNVKNSILFKISNKNQNDKCSVNYFDIG